MRLKCEWSVGNIKEGGIVSSFNNGESTHVNSNQLGLFTGGQCCGPLVHYVKIRCYDWCNKDMNGQQFGRRYRCDFQAERGRGEGVQAQEEPGDVKKNEEVQDGKEIMLHDRLQNNISGLISIKSQ